MAKFSKIAVCRKEAKLIKSLRQNGCTWYEVADKINAKHNLTGDKEVKIETIKVVDRESREKPKKKFNKKVQLLRYKWDSTLINHITIT